MTLTTNNATALANAAGKTTETELPTTAEGVKGPRVVKHIDVRVDEAREDVAKAQAKLDKLIQQQADAARYDSIAVDDNIRFNFGRGEKLRVLSGKVIAVGDSENGQRQLAVQVGEGLDQQTLRIPALAVVFGDNAEVTA